MNQRKILALLKEHLPDLQQFGITSLALFGSFAREEATLNSDIDILVKMDPPFTYDRYINAKFYLEDLLNFPVDLIMIETLRPEISQTVNQEAIYVS